MTSMGLLFLAVLRRFGQSVIFEFKLSAAGLPCVRNDYVVEWGVSFSKSSESDFDNH